MCYTLATYMIAGRTAVSYTCLPALSEHPHVDSVIVRSALTMWTALASTERMCACHLSVESSRTPRTRMSLLGPTLCPSSSTSALILNFPFVRLKWISSHLLEQNCDPCLFAHFWHSLWIFASFLQFCSVLSLYVRPGSILFTCVKTCRFDMIYLPRPLP